MGVVDEDVVDVVLEDCGFAEVEVLVCDNEMRCDCRVLTRL